MSESEKKKLSIGESIGEGVGQVFETIGRGAFHVARTPVVGTGLKKAGNRIGTGYTKEETRVLKAKIAKDVTGIARKAKVTTSEQVRACCVAANVPEEYLDDICERVAKRVLKQESTEPESTEAPMPPDGAYSAAPAAAAG